MSRPPKGLILANKDEIILNIDSLYQQVVLSNAMPPGNITWMEYTERETIKLLYQEILKNPQKSAKQILPGQVLFDESNETTHYSIALIHREIRYLKFSSTTKSRTAEYAHIFILRERNCRRSLPSRAPQTSRNYQDFP